MIFNEPPKLFPFMKFDVEKIRGNMLRDEDGEFIFNKFERASDGSLRYFD